jgi:hypothetical protein
MGDNTLVESNITGTEKGKGLGKMTGILTQDQARILTRIFEDLEEAVLNSDSFETFSLEVDSSTQKLTFSISEMFLPDGSPMLTIVPVISTINRSGLSSSSQGSGNHEQDV